MELSRVLSIQSHVVRGYVGNKCATFPLQVLGLEVDAVNSVQFSNHTGYEVVKGQVLKATDLDELMCGLSANKLDFYSHLLTGYVGDPTFLTQIIQIVKHLKTVNPRLKYVCDPVMGDGGKMYVPESLLPIYRNDVIPLADIITPNQFELELLTGKKIISVSDAWNAIELCHDKGCNVVVLSSADISKPDELLTFASSITGGSKKRVLAAVPKLEANFTGTGDVFAAVFLAWMNLTGDDLSKSLSNTLSTIQAVLKRTLRAASGAVGDGTVPNVGQLELRLIQSKHDIENPPNFIKCQVID